MTGCSKKKLSIAEQIELYERINRESEANEDAGKK